MNKKIITLTSLFIVSGLVLVGCDFFSQTAEPTPAPTPVRDLGVVAEANLIPVESISFGFSIPGKVGEILIEEGDQVNEGDILANLVDTESLKAQVAAAELAVLRAKQDLEDLLEKADLASAQAQVALVKARQDLVAAEQEWDKVDADDFQEHLDDTRVEMLDAEADLDDARETLADYEDLAEDNPLRESMEEQVNEAQQAYDEATWAFKTLKNQFELAESQLNLALAAMEDAERVSKATQNGPDPDDLALAEASLDQAEAQLAAAKSALAEATLTAPFSGTIVHIDLTENVETTPGQVGFVLADLSEWYLETNDLTEDEVVRIKEGEEVKITFDALPEKSFTGEVESISDFFQEQFGDITYRVRIRLLESNSDLRWGMTAEVLFED